MKKGILLLVMLAFLAVPPMASASGWAWNMDLKWRKSAKKIKKFNKGMKKIEKKAAKALKKL